MPVLPLTGGCMCGALRYALTRAPLTVSNCHCTNCQKISGSPFATTAIILASGFEFTRGTPKRTEWDSSVGTRRVGLFCGDCGSRIVHGMVPDGPTYSLRTGTLDDCSWIRPVGDIWTDSAQPWVTLPETRLTYPRQPADYSDMIAAFAALGQFP